MSNFISLAKAVQMTKSYRGKKDNIVRPEFAGRVHPISETFDAAMVEKLVRQPGCKEIRIYYGMNPPDMMLHAILVGVDEHGYDMLPYGSEYTSVVNDGENLILEDGGLCPPICPPPPNSPLVEE